MALLETNVGRMDRLVRIAVGGSLVIYGAGLPKLAPPPYNFLVIAVGLVILATGLLGTCALYSVLGIDTGGKSAPSAPARKSRRK
jgi:hypothetical protein